MVARKSRPEDVVARNLSSDRKAYRWKACLVCFLVWVAARLSGGCVPPWMLCSTSSKLTLRSKSW